jgi:hypothetical protein
MRRRLPDWVRAAALLTLGAAGPPLRAGEPPAYDPSLAAGTTCAVEVVCLHPTQFAIGLEEVRLRSEGIERRSAAALDRYLRRRIAPIVIGPGGVPYLLDRHHLARLLLDTGVRPTLYARVEQNWRHLDTPAFWAAMQARGWVHLYDENGRGPLDPAQLPATVGALRDDPFRTLAWAVRHRDGYRETDVLYADFHWANFFRARIPLDLVRQRFEEAVTAGVRLARSPEAAGLPGYRP